MKTKLPKVTTPCSDPEIQKCDRTAKAKMKTYVEKKRYTKPSTIKEGDAVFVKRDNSKMKSDTSYNPRPLIIMEKTGSMVTTQDDDGVPVTRNSSFFKSVPAAAEENSTTIWYFC